MNDFSVLAEAFAYPQPGKAEELRAAVDQLESGTVRKRFARFVDEVAALSPAEWEELHTRTLDLSPLFAPYVGYMAWGDNYQRGEFMAMMKVALEAAGIDGLGELPDHLSVVLKLLGSGEPVPPTLLEVFPVALEKMRKELGAAEKANPYRQLLSAIAQVDVPEMAGGTQ